MWSPTLLFDLRAYGPEKLSLVTQKGFCNTIPHKADIDRRDRDVRFVPLPDSFQSYLKKELLPL
jgi:hypothetical protein